MTPHAFMERAARLLLRLDLSMRRCHCCGVHGDHAATCEVGVLIAAARDLGLLD